MGSSNGGDRVPYQGRIRKDGFHKDAGIRKEELSRVMLAFFTIHKEVGYFQNSLLLKWKIKCLIKIRVESWKKLVHQKKNISKVRDNTEERNVCRTVFWVRTRFWVRSLARRNLLQHLRNAIWSAASGQGRLKRFERSAACRLQLFYEWIEVCAEVEMVLRNVCVYMVWFKFNFLFVCFDYVFFFHWNFL